MTRLNLIGVGLVAPGLPDWQAAQAVLTGQQPYAAAPIANLAPAALPPNERRRATLGTRLALAATEQPSTGLASVPSALATVFTASESDLGIIDRLCTDIFGRHCPVSPTVFHNSVHNSIAGYWSIAHGCRAASTSLSAWDGSLAAGLLECAVQVADRDQPVLLVAYDVPGPALFDPHRHLDGPFACALLLTPAGSASGAAAPPLATLTLDLDALGEPDRLPPDLDPALETLRSGNPAARVLPLLQHIAAGRRGQVRLPYLDDLDLSIRLS